MGLLIYLIAFWGLSHLWHTYVAPPSWRRRRNLKLLAAQLREKLRWNSDKLSEEQRADLEALRERTLELRRDKRADAKTCEDHAQTALTRLDKYCPNPPHAWVKETIEMLIVVFGVVMGFRAVVMQPFKIPTGSMQPTLYGIHFEHEERVPERNKVQRVFDFLNYGQRAADATIKRAGFVEGATGGSHVRLGPLALEYTDVKMDDGQAYRLPGPPDQVQKYVQESFLRQHDPRMWPQWLGGDVLARGYLTAGDHLFVDRIWYKFAEPRRGDIVVFTTDGIRHRGQPLSGFFFIKRLVGLPGETIKIEKRHLYVKEAGSDEFRLVDGDDDPGFEYMYSMQGGYHGYYLPPAPPALDAADFLNVDSPAVTLGPDQYFVMGDNSENSLDSRYWGPVPRDHVIGLARVVWWPLSRRFGRADRTEPGPEHTPPEKPDGMSLAGPRR